MKESFKELYKKDMARYCGWGNWYIKRFHYLLRKAQTTTGAVHKLYHVLLKYHREKHGLEISDGVKLVLVFT